MNCVNSVFSFNREYDVQPSKKPSGARPSDRAASRHITVRPTWYRIRGRIAPWPSRIKITVMATSMRKLSLVQVDVFTDRALTGNALAVILDGRGLTTEQMQALARETNLSETTFILPGDAAAEKARGVRVRIFTVQEELPFAGHATLGTAFVLRGKSGAAEVRLELNVGTVPVRFTQTGSSPLAFGEMTQEDPGVGAVHGAHARGGRPNR